MQVLCEKRQAKKANQSNTNLHLFYSRSAVYVCICFCVVLYIVVVQVEANKIEYEIWFTFCHVIKKTHISSFLSISTREKNEVNE